MYQKLQFIIDAYGVASQIDVSVEECSELIKALIKFRRKPSDEKRKDVIEEIADVEVMLNQLKIIFSCESEVEAVVKNKIDRQIERIMNHE